MSKDKYLISTAPGIQIDVPIHTLSGLMRRIYKYVGNCGDLRIYKYKKTVKFSRKG